MSGMVQLIGNSGKVRLASHRGEILTGGCCVRYCKTLIGYDDLSNPIYSECEPPCFLTATITGLDAVLESCFLLTLPGFANGRIQNPNCDGTITLVFDVPQPSGVGYDDTWCVWRGYLARGLTLDVFQTTSGTPDCVAPVHHTMLIDVILEIARNESGLNTSNWYFTVWIIEHNHPEDGVGIAPVPAYDSYGTVDTGCVPPLPWTTSPQGVAVTASLP